MNIKNIETGKVHAIGKLRTQAPMWGSGCGLRLRQCGAPVSGMPSLFKNLLAPANRTPTFRQKYGWESVTPEELCRRCFKAES